MTSFSFVSRTSAVCFSGVLAICKSLYEKLNGRAGVIRQSRRNESVHLHLLGITHSKAELESWGRVGSVKVAIIDQSALGKVGHWVYGDWAIVTIHWVV